MRPQCPAHSCEFLESRWSGVVEFRARPHPPTPLHHERCTVQHRVFTGLNLPHSGSQRVNFTFLCLFEGSVVKKARAQGVKVETLKLPPITSLAVGMYYVCETVQWNLSNRKCPFCKSGTWGGESVLFREVSSVPGCPQMCVLVPYRPDESTGMGQCCHLSLWTRFCSDLEPPQSHHRETQAPPTPQVRQTPGDDVKSCDDHVTCHVTL